MSIQPTDSLYNSYAQIHRAVVQYSSTSTGEIQVVIPSVTGLTTSVPVSYFGREAHPFENDWVVPNVGSSIVVCREDEDYTSVYWMNTTYNPVRADVGEVNPTEFNFGPEDSESIFDLSDWAGHPTSAGLYLGSIYMGFHTGSNGSAGWRTYMDYTGKFYLGGTSGSLQWDGTNLAITGSITIAGSSSALVEDEIANSELAGAAGRTHIGLPNVDNDSTSTIRATAAAVAGTTGGWTIGSDAIYSGSRVISGFSSSGITLYSGGSIHAPEFYLDAGGSAHFKGTVTGGLVQTAASGDRVSLVGSGGRLEFDVSTTPSGYASGFLNAVYMSNDVIDSVSHGAGSYLAMRSPKMSTENYSPGIVLRHYTDGDSRIELQSGSLGATPQLLLEDTGGVARSVFTGTVTATTFIGALTGTASAATTATVVADGSNTTRYPMFVGSTSGDLGAMADAGLAYNPSSNTLTTTTFSGALSGNASTASRWANSRTLTLTGAVTGSVTFHGGGAIGSLVTSVNHTHNYAASNHDHNTLYYTESEINTQMSGKSGTGHTHNYAAYTHYHDTRYYTETEINSQMAGKSATGHTHAGSALTGSSLASGITSSSLTSVGTLSALTMTGSPIINNTAPVVYLKDTDHRSGGIHVNSNIFYVLRMNGANSTVLESTGGYWPLTISLETNDATFGGDLAVPAGHLTVGSYITTANGTETAPTYRFTSSSTHGTYYASGFGVSGVYLTANSWGWAATSNGPYGNVGTLTGTDVVASGVKFGKVSSRGALKENITTVSSTDALGRIAALRSVEFNFKQAAYDQGTNEMVTYNNQRGFIAEEVAAVDHWLAHWGWVDPADEFKEISELDAELDLSDAVPVDFNARAIVADLVSVVQDLSTKLEAAESRIAALEAS
jgi:hypothetical protein